MKFLVFDSMMPDEPPLLLGECDDEKRLLRLSGRRGDSWTSTVQSAIAQRGAPSDLSHLACLNSRFYVALTDDGPVELVDPVDLIGGSSGIAPGQAPTASNPQAEVLAAIRKGDPNGPVARIRAAKRLGADRPRRRRRSERAEPDSE